MEWLLLQNLFWNINASATSSLNCTANVLAVNSTFYFCVKNPLTVSCDFSRYLSVVYQDQYSALFTEK